MKCRTLPASTSTNATNTRHLSHKQRCRVEYIAFNNRESNYIKISFWLRNEFFRGCVNWLLQLVKFLTSFVLSPTLVRKPCLGNTFVCTLFCIYVIISVLYVEHGYVYQKLNKQYYVTHPMSCDPTATNGTKYVTLTNACIHHRTAV